MTTARKGLVEAIVQGRSLIVCGAGVSRLATDGEAPGWAQLIDLGLRRAKPDGESEPAWVRACAERLKPDASTEDWLKAATEIQEKLGGQIGGQYRAFLSDAIGKLRTKDSAVIDALRTIGCVRLPSGNANHIATTNYDDLLHKGLKWDRVTWKDTNSLAECLNGDHEAVIHLHGHWRDPTSVVFSGRDYERLRSAESAQFLQQLAAHRFTLVFMGCSTSGLADENVGALLDWFGTHWAGLGKKHFVLVRETESGAGWPDSVTPIVYGRTFDELPGFLAGLVPAASSGVAATRERVLFPPDPKMIGRQNRRKELVRHILKGDRPVIIPGGPGMGKTTLALAAAYDKHVLKAFGKARFFVNLEPVTSADAMLRAVATAVGVDISGSMAGILESVVAHVCKQPTLAILDNLDTPWLSEPVKTEATIAQLAAAVGLRLVLTVRGETPRVSGGAQTLDDVPRLPDDDAKALFLRESRPRFAADAALPELLAALDGHPLSIVLMAAQTDGRVELSGLAQEWQTHRAAVLQRGSANDRLTSVRASLALSVDRLAVRHDAKRVLGLIALLPAGFQREDIAIVLPDALADVARILEKARLVEIRNGRLTMLAPLREAASTIDLATAEDRTRLIEYFLDIAKDGNAIGTSTWPEVRDQVTREMANLDAVCLLAIQESEAWKNCDVSRLEIALHGLGKLHRYGLPAEVRSLNAAYRLPDSIEFARLRMSCIESLGDIALARYEHNTAQTHYEQALSLYERAGLLLGQAGCVEGLGDIALARSDHNTALVKYGEALTLYERAGSLFGQAACIKSIGDIAFAKSDFDAALIRYEEARALYKGAGSSLGEANCIRGAGDTALARSDHHTARARFEEAQPLYEQVGDLLGQANCLQSLGDIELALSNHAAARAQYEGALGLYARIPEPYSIGFAHLGLMRAAAIQADRLLHRKAAQAAWASIGRQDLIAEHGLATA